VQQQQAAAAVAAEASEATEAATPEALEVAEEAEVLKIAEALEAAEHPESPGSDLARASTAASSSAASSAPSGSASSSGLNPNAPKFRSGREACPYEQIGLPCLTRPGGGCLRCDHFKEGKCKRKTTCKYCHCLTPRGATRGGKSPRKPRNEG